MKASSSPTGRQIMYPSACSVLMSSNVVLLRSRRHRRPAHGPAVTRPQQLVRGMIGHRMQREKQILKRLGAGDRSVAEIVAAAYPGLDPRLVPAAGGSVTAHLLDLVRRGMVVRSEDETWMTA